MISLRNITASSLPKRGTPPRVLRNITMTFEAGVHAVLGTQRDGTDLLHAVLDGRLSPMSGEVRVSGLPPKKAAAHLASIPLDVALPDSLSVSQMIDLSARFRNAAQSDIRRAVEALGLAPLLPRLGKSLRKDEQRAVALALAIGAAVKAIVLEEPFSAIDPSVAPLLGDALKEIAQQGSVVIVTTASANEARTIASAIYRLSRGELVRASQRSSSLIQAAWVRIYSEQARALLAALAESDFPIDVELHGHALTARSASTQFDLSRAMAKAIVRSGVRPFAIESAPPDLVPMTPSMFPGAPS